MTADAYGFFRRRVEEGEDRVDYKIVGTFAIQEGKADDRQLPGLYETTNTK